MIQTVMKVEGMMCGMCEAHVNDAVRRSLDVKKVTSSHSKGETVILSERELCETTLREAVESVGYKTGEMCSRAYEKRGFFDLFRKN